MLVCGVGALYCAIPTAYVDVTTPALSVERITTEGPAAVSGVTMVRGLAVAVVDARRLLGQPDDVEPRRFVVVRQGVGGAALAVDSAERVIRVPRSELQAMSPLLGVGVSELVQSLTRVEQRLVALLSAVRIVELADLGLALHAPGGE